MQRAGITSYEVRCVRCGHSSANERGCGAKGMVGEKRTKHLSFLAGSGICIVLTLDLSNSATDSSHQA